MKTFRYVYRKMRTILSEIIFRISSIESLWQFKISGMASFHHIRLNVTDIDSTLAYYSKFFGAKKVKYQNRADALLTEKSFLLLNLVDAPPSTHLGSSLWHIGWSGVDAQDEFDWRVAAGIKVHTPITPLDEDFWMYFWGPNGEVVEVYTQKKKHSFEHIHLLASDVGKTMNWFKSHLGLSPVYRKYQKNSMGFKWNFLYVDNIYIVVFGKPDKDELWWPKEAFKSTDGKAIDHIGFSFESIEPIFEEMKSAGSVIVHEIKNDPVYGHKSFFVRGPDELLVEIVEEKEGVEEELNTQD